MKQVGQVILYWGCLWFCPKKKKERLFINLAIHSVMFNKIIAVSLKSNDERVYIGKRIDVAPGVPSQRS